MLLSRQQLSPRQQGKRKESWFALQQTPPERRQSGSGRRQPAIFSLVRAICLVSRILAGSLAVLALALDMTSKFGLKNAAYHRGMLPVSVPPGFEPAEWDSILRSIKPLKTASDITPGAALFGCSSVLKICHATSSNRRKLLIFLSYMFSLNAYVQDNSANSLVTGNVVDLTALHVFANAASFCHSRNGADAIPSKSLLVSFAVLLSACDCGIRILDHLLSLAGDNCQNEVIVLLEQCQRRFFLFDSLVTIIQHLCPCAVVYAALPRDDGAVAGRLPPGSLSPGHLDDMSTYPFEFRCRSVRRRLVSLIHRLFVELPSLKWSVFAGRSFLVPLMGCLLHDTHRRNILLLCPGVVATPSEAMAVIGEDDAQVVAILLELCETPGLRFTLPREESSFLFFGILEVLFLWQERLDDLCASRLERCCELLIQVEDNQELFARSFQKFYREKVSLSGTAPLASFASYIERRFSLTIRVAT